MADNRVPSGRRSFLVAVLVVVVGVAAMYVGYSGWRYHQSTLEDSLREARLIRDIDRVSLVGNVLGLLEDGEEEKVRKLLEFHLQATLKQVDPVIGDGPTVVSIAVPNLRVGVDRAREYAEQRGMPEAAAQAEKLLAALDAAPGRPGD